MRRAGLFCSGYPHRLGRRCRVLLVGLGRLIVASESTISWSPLGPALAAYARSREVAGAAAT